MLLDLVRDESPAGRARLHYFLINKGPWSRLDHNQPFVPGAPAKPEGANFYPANASKAEIERWIQSLPEAERARATGFFTRHQARRHRLLPSCPTASSIRTSLRAPRALLREAAQPGDRADAEDVSHEARRRVPVERLLRQRRRLDGAQGGDRADDRPVRGVRGRMVQLQGGVRVVHHRTGRSRNGQAPEVRRRAAGHREPPADRSRHRNPKLGGARADRGRQRDLRRRRREPRRADRGVQPAERRARDPRKGRQARDAEERAGREVREDAGADLESRARRPPIRRPCRSTRSSRTSSCTS